jgi:hypothetical protein
MTNTARALLPLAVFFLFAGCRSQPLATVPTPNAPRPITASPNQIVGRVLSIDANLGFAILDLAPTAPAAALQPGARLIARTDDLRPTARLQVSRHRSGRTLGTVITDGQPAVGDEVIFRAP